jgi:hypothetical protein
MPRVPILHLNGTSSEVLLEGYREVGHAIIALADKIHAAAPNSRDYYPLAGNAYEHARNECAANLAELDKLRIYYLEMLQGIQAQVDQRARLRSV